MKNVKTYIPSLLLSILLVFSMLGISGLLVVRSFADSDKLTGLAEENKIVSTIQSELESYFSNKYNETGVPAEVYTAALTDEYIEKIVGLNINAGFERLDSGKFDNLTGRENPELEESISIFFNDYADSIGYVKDDKYEEKLQKTIDSAYSVITDYCDIYKFRMMNSEGILAKASKIYTRLDMIILAVAGATVLLIVLLLLINIKSKLLVKYWLGISALVSGVIGISPCIYLNASRFFDAFVIKQPQIFKSFTGLLYGAVNSFMINQIILAAAGILLIVLFAVISKKIKTS